jgi:hypothetical protein
MPIFIREENSPHWYELQASHLSASMQANFSHTTSLSHNCQCLNVSHVFIVSVTAPFWCILYLFINILWNTGPKQTAIQTVIKLRKWDGQFISDTWHNIVNVTGRCVQHWIYLHLFFLNKEKVWGVAESSVGGTTSFQKQNLQSYNITWEVRTLKDKLQLTLAAISCSDWPFSSREKYTLWFQGVNSTCSATVPYPTNAVH